MSKIDVNNVGSFEPIKGVSPNDIKRTTSEETAAIDAKNSVKKTDKVEISGRASEAKQLVDQLKSLPDVRMEKVNELRDRMAAGKFNPPSSEIADAIIKDEF